VKRLAAALAAVVLAGPVAAQAPLANEFWVAWPETEDITATDPGYDLTGALILQTESPTPVPVTVDAPGLAWSGTTVRDSPARVVIPRALMIDTDGVVESKGIRIHSSSCEPIAVLFRLPGTGASFADEAFRVLPVTELGTEYFPDTYHGAAQFAIVATEDATTVSWDNPHCPGAVSVILDRGESVQHQCLNDDGMTVAQRGIVGTRIASDKPVAVIAGSARSEVIHYILTAPPADIFWSFQDVLLEQMRPTSAWRHTYRTVPFVGTSPGWAGDLIRIIASCDDTTVTVFDGVASETMTLAAGAYWDLVDADLLLMTFDLKTVPLLITASHPVQVSQYSVGHANAGIGDPSQVMVPPLDGAPGIYPFNVDPDYEVHVDVVIETSATGSVLLDGAPLAPAAWATHVDGLYAWTQLTGLVTGQHRLESPAPLAVTVIGYSLDAMGLDLEGAFSYAPFAAGGGSSAPLAVTSDSACGAHCPGECATLATTAGFASHAWTTGDMTNPIMVCPLVTTTYDVTVVDTQGCSAAGATQVDVFAVTPLVIAPILGPLCAGDCVSLSVGSGWTSIRWSTGETSDTITVCPPAGSSTYGVTVTDGNGCEQTASIVLDSNPLPTVDAGPDVAVCAGDSEILGATPVASGTTGPYQFDWTPIAGLDDPALEHPTATPSVATTYTVAVTDGIGCRQTATTTVSILASVEPGTIGNTLMHVRRGRDLEASWAAEPDARLYRYRSADDKRFLTPTLEAEPGINGTTLGGALDLPPEPGFYRVVGVGCGDLEGP